MRVHPHQHHRADQLLHGRGIGTAAAAGPSAAATRPGPGRHRDPHLLHRRVHRRLGIRRYQTHATSSVHIAADPEPGSLHHQPPEHITPTPTPTSSDWTALLADQSPPSPEPEHPWRTHTVKQGDTLWDLADRAYGSGALCPALGSGKRAENAPGEPDSNGAQRVAHLGADDRTDRAFASPGLLQKTCLIASAGYAGSVSVRICALPPDRGHRDLVRVGACCSVTGLVLLDHVGRNATAVVDRDALLPGPGPDIA